MFLERVEKWETTKYEVRIDILNKARKSLNLSHQELKVETH